MNILKISLITLFVMLFTGCSATKYQVDPKLVEKFQEKKVAEDKVGVYVIRGSNFQGGARGLWVAMNDKVVADLSNSSHVYLEVDSDINTLHFVQSLAGTGYLALDGRAGETVFAKFDYAVTNATTELEPALGKTIVMKTDEVQPLKETRKNDAYDNLLVNPSNVGYEFMKASDEEILPDDEHAVVTFYRPDSLIKDVKFDVWNQSGYIGSTTGGNYFSVKLKAGEHTFFTLSERYSLLKSTLDANKSYAVELDVGMGWNQAHIKLLPINLNKKNKIKKWEAKLKHEVLNTEAMSLLGVKTRIELGNDYLTETKEKVDKKEISSRDLPANFGL